MGDKLMHITNYYGGRGCSTKYKHNMDASEKSSKWSLSMWQEAVTEQGHDIKIALLKVEDLVIKTLICAQDIIASGYDA